VGLPTSAHLFVRRLEDPLPHGLRCDGQAYAPSPNWSLAFQRALDRHAREAARPALGPVPPTANAVLFAGQAELLACLAKDLVGGEATLRWWWAALRRSLPPGALDALVAAWCREAAAVPAAIDNLVRGRAAEAVLQALTPPQAIAVLRAVVTAFDLPNIATVVADVSIAVPRPQLEDPAAAAAATAPAVAPRLVAPPWEPLVPAALVPRSLRPERRLLLGVSLTLARAPLLARSKVYAQQLAMWWRAELAGDEAGSPIRPSTRLADAQPVAQQAIDSGPDVVETPSVAPKRPRGVRKHSSALTKARPTTPPTPRPLSMSGADTPRQVSERTAIAPPRARGSRRDRQQQTVRPGKAPPPGSTLRSTSVLHPAVSHGAQPSAASSNARGEESKAPVKAPTPVLRPPVPSVVEPSFAASEAVAWTATELGGAFFLINVFLQLDFFTALERHVAMAPAVGGWAWIELVTRALLGRRNKRHRDDAVWRCLAALDGRDPMAPLNVPADERRFLDLVMPSLRRRLKQALRLRREPDIATVLIECRAQLFASATHVDVRFPLETARFAIRVAGLDATPGWVPALGRVVSFEFV
jgi:hypothetical protein